MKKSKKALQSNTSTKKVKVGNTPVTSLRIDPKTKASLQKKADKYAGGNLSQFLIMAGKAFEQVDY